MSNDHADVRLDLQALVERTWATGAYEMRINYREPCVPALDREDQAWANELIRQANHPSPGSE